jgi:hypothetical protein
MLNSGLTTWDFQIYGGKDVNITLDYGISDACKTNNVGNSCSSPLVLTESISAISKALPSDQWLLSVDEAKDISAMECNYKITVDTFDPPTNRPKGQLKKIVKQRLTRNFNPATCDVKASTVQDLGAEALITDNSVKTGYIAIRSAPAITARPPPTEKTLQGCNMKCSDPTVISKLMADYNRTSGPNSKIIRVKKASTPTETACDYLMDMVIRDAQGRTKTIETARRLEITKVGTSCSFDFKTMGDSDSAFYIQDNTPEQPDKIGFASSYTNFMGTLNKGLNDFMDSIYTTDTFDKPNKKLTASELKVKNTIVFSQPRYLDDPLVGTNKQCSDPDIVQLLEKGVQKLMDQGGWSTLSSNGILRAYADTSNDRDYKYKVCITQYEYVGKAGSTAAGQTGTGVAGLAFRNDSAGKLEAYVQRFNPPSIDTTIPTIKEIRDMQAQKVQLEQKAVADAAAALAAQQAAGGFKTVQGCGFTPNKKVVRETVEKYLRDRANAQPNKEWDSMSYTFKKWGYDDATNTVFYNYTINLSYWWGPLTRDGTGGFVFTKGLCSPLVIESAAPADASKAPNNFVEVA